MDAVSRFLEFFAGRIANERTRAGVQMERAMPAFTKRMSCISVPWARISSRKPRNDVPIATRIAMAAPNDGPGGGVHV